MLGKFFDYPLKTSNILRNLPPWVLGKAMADYAAVRVRDRIRPIPDDCFQNYILKRFGSTLYRLFFGTYTEKAWGIPCTQISADWASQRITLLNLMDTIKKTLFRPKNVPRTLVSKFIYPIDGGIGQISERYAEEIGKSDANRIQTGVDIQRFRREGNRVVAVDYTRQGSSESDAVDSVISTIPVTTAIDLFDPAPPQEVIDARYALRFKAIVFVMLALDREKVTDDHWIYLPEQDLKVHRISEFKNFSEECAPPGKTLVCAEITCNFDDDIWNMEKDHLTELAAGDLEKIGLLKKHEVLESFIFRERYSYPLYDLTYKAQVKTCLDWLKQFDNFLSTGRQGLFQYGNMDHSIAMGLVLANKLLSGKGEDHAALLASEEHVD